VGQDVAAAMRARRAAARCPPPAVEHRPARGERGTDTTGSASPPFSPHAPAYARHTGPLGRATIRTA